MHQITTLVPPVINEAIRRQAIAAQTTIKAALPADEVIVQIDGVHPTHRAKTGNIWMKRGEKLHVPGNTGWGRINIHGP